MSQLLGATRKIFSFARNRIFRWVVISLPMHHAQRATRKIFLGVTKFELARIRTWNLVIRSQTRYPLRNKPNCEGA